MAITTGGTVTLTAGTLDSTFCHTTWQSTLDEFVDATSVSFNGGALFTASSSTPSSSDENKLWCKMAVGDADVLGWYYYDGATWQAVPIPVASALPVSGVTAGSYGDADNHVTMTVDVYGRVTALASTTPTAVENKGLARAWAKFPGSNGTAVNSYNCSISKTGDGQYTITTSGTTFTSSPIVIASHSGFAYGTTSSDSFTVSPAVRVTTTSVNGANNGVAELVIQRANWDGQEADDGDETWDAAYDNPDTVSVVFYGD